MKASEYLTTVKAQDLTVNKVIPETLRAVPKSSRKPFGRLGEPAEESLESHGVESGDDQYESENSMIGKEEHEEERILSTFKIACEKSLLG